jgi:hypothetical protein
VQDSCTIRVSKEKRDKGENLFSEKMVENSPNLIEALIYSFKMLTEVKRINKGSSSPGDIILKI